MRVPRREGAISRAELASLLGDVRLVEALGAQYYADAHLPGAVNLPPGLVEAMAVQLLPERSDLVVVYASASSLVCAESVASALRALGYRRVRVYREGKEDWVEAGLPVHRGPLP